MKQHSLLKKFVCCLSFLVFAGSSHAFGQVAPSATAGSGLYAFASFGGQVTRVIDFNYKALGYDGGLYLQRSPFIGIEARAARFSMYARYPQMPITAGYRAEMRVHQKYLLAAYAGGGLSHSVDAGAHYKALPASWEPCMQVSQSGAIDLGRFKWKVYEATFTDTFTSRRNLPALSLTTGIVYSFSSGRRYR